MNQENSFKQMIQEDNNAINKQLANVKHKLIVLSGKGGVGKSSVSVNLACALAKEGKKVGLLDADLHGPTIPTMLALNTSPPANEEGGIMPIETNWGVKVISLGLFLPSSDEAVIWRGPMKMGAIKQFLRDVIWGELDYLIIDCPPGTGDEPLSVIQLIPNPDGAIIVTSPQESALAAVRKSITFIKKMNLRGIGIVENFAGYVCPHCNQISYPFGKDGGKELSEYSGIELIASIPLFYDMAERADKGEPIVSDENHPASKLYIELANKIDRAISNKR